MSEPDMYLELDGEINIVTKEPGKPDVREAIDGEVILKLLLQILEGEVQHEAEETVMNDTKRIEDIEAQNVPNFAGHNIARLIKELRASQEKYAKLQDDCSKLALTAVDLSRHLARTVIDRNDARAELEQARRDTSGAIERGDYFIAERDAAQAEVAKLKSAKFTLETALKVERRPDWQKGAIDRPANVELSAAKERDALKAEVQRLQGIAPDAHDIAARAYVLPPLKYPNADWANFPDDHPAMREAVALAYMLRRAAADGAKAERAGCLAAVDEVDDFSNTDIRYALGEAQARIRARGTGGA